MRGTLDEALQGVAAYNAPSSEDEDLLEKRRKAISKHRKSSKEKSRKSKSKKEKEHSKKKSSKDKHKKDKEKESSAEASDESDSDLNDINVQLERGRAAVRITREILQQQPGLKTELRQLLWRVDQGEAVQIAGIPDSQLRKQLDDLFLNIGLAKTSKGIYAKRPGSSACLILLGPVIAEASAETSSRVASQQQQQQQAAGPSKQTGDPPQDGVLADSSSHAEQVVERRPSDEEERRAQEAPGEGRQAAHADAEPAPVIGPQGPPAEEDAINTRLDQAVVEDAEVEHANGDGEVLGGMAGPDDGRGPDSASAEEPAVSRRRVAGPAMPPAELLAAAAEAKQAMDAEMEEEEDDLIGPAPPELVDELENAGSDDRSKEVIRILRVLESTKTEAPDAYAALGVEVEAKGTDIKKRYWRLSLLIHPDKCDHPRANDAFQAINKAAKDLQDTGKRKAIDADREDARLRRLAEEMATQQERERQWRVARGTATAEDMRGPIRAGPAQRDTWMTDLPEARRPNAQPSQVNVTTFSQRGIQERGDTRSWTETPQQKLLRLSAGEAATSLALESAAVAAPSASAGAVDAYNKAHRPKTLMEQHQERLKDEKKKKKKRKAEEQSKGKTDAAAADEWDPTVHPWRPFDREKDLNIGPKVVSKEELLKKSGTLDSRFAGTPSGQRSFL